MRQHHFVLHSGPKQRPGSRLCHKEYCFQRVYLLFFSAVLFTKAATTSVTPSSVGTHEPQITFTNTGNTSTSNNSSTDRFHPPNNQSSRESLPFSRKPNRVEIEGYTIGDGHRSETSSGSFFSAIDRDGDGNLDRPELSRFLHEQIGGDEFDTKEELKRGVESVLTNVDLNADNGLDEMDVNSYWKRYLDGLFGVEDVTEWLEHAVQLPPEERRKFCLHGVTGYDFPELVENNGRRLETELGISNLIHRRQISRLIKARMLGLESTLPKVNVDIHHVKCNHLQLTWENVESRSGFPVHKYRVQRLEVPKHGTEGVETSIARREVDISEDDRFDPCTVSKSKNWETVYDGKHNSYHDVSMRAGFEYTYRIEAWNAIGRSPWVIISKEETWWGVLRCKNSSNNDNTTTVPPTSSISKIQSFGNFFTLLKSIVCFIIPLVGYMFKFQHPNNQSKWLKRVQSFLNRLSQLFGGIDILPQTNIEDIMRDQSMTYVNGGSELVSHSQRSQPRIIRNPTPPPKEESSRTKEESIRTIDSEITIPSTSPSESKSSTPMVQKKEKKRFKPPWKKKTKTLSILTSENSERDCTVVNIDHKRCKICQKSYALFKRTRHVCSICHGFFCHKDGNCTHSNLTPCPVPGTCVCRNCLESRSSRQ